MRRLWTDIVQPCILPLVRMQQRGIRFDEKAARKEISKAKGERGDRESLVVGGAGRYISSAMPELPRWDPCRDHPDYQGRTVRRRCPACREIWEETREYRKSPAVRRATRLANFNVASPEHLAWLLFDCFKLKPVEYTDTGKPRTNLKSLEELLTRKTTPESVVPILRNLIEIAHLDTLVSVFLSPPVGSDGRVHPPLTLEGTSIGRVRSGMSRFDPDKPSDDLAFNIQNIPERVRHVYIADPGTLMLEVDAAKIEWILLMLYARATRADRAYREPGFDVHTMNAQLITKALGLEWARLNEEERKEWRWQAKRFTHAVDYGMLESKMSRVYRIPIGDARRIREAYLRGWPEVLQYQKDTESQALLDLKLRNCFGRVRRFLDVTARMVGGRKELHLGELNEALAFLPASTNADIWKIRVRELDDAGFTQVTGTHDSHLMIVAEDAIEKETRRAREICERPIEELAGFVGSEWWSPIYTAAWGSNWGPQSESNPGGLKKIAAAD